MSSSFNVGWLKYGLTGKRHATRGWLKKLLVQQNLLVDGNDAIWMRVMSDYQCQLVAMEVMRSIQGSDYKDPRLVTEHGVFKGKEDGRYQKKKTGIPTGVFTVPYLIYAYDVSETSFKRKRKELKEGKLCIPVAEHATHHSGTSVINNSQLCKERYNARYFFVRNKVLSGESPGPNHVGLWNTHMVRQKYWGAVYDERVNRSEIDERDEDHRLAREHVARQPSIQEDILEALRANVCTSYRSLSRYINGWCTASTIEHWFKLHEDYHIYSKNIKPGLTPENKVKQVEFSKHVHNLWGLPQRSGRPILWIMCDEKWFHALVPRTNAKACEALGLPKSSYSAHHKSHIGKVMVHCLVGYLFTDDPELGGQGFLIACNRCAGFKVPLRDIRYSSRDPVTKKLTFVGNAIKHAKGIPYLVDCNVTGSNPGTPTTPCFPLKSLWERCLIPSVEKLVAPGGPCEGALVILQEDNAGPHTEGIYHKWITEAFEERHWRIELQAPQGHTILIFFSLFIWYS